MTVSWHFGYEENDGIYNPKICISRKKSVPLHFEIKWHYELGFSHKR